MELVLNDLSSSNPTNNINSGRELMKDFILVCKNAVLKGAERSLRTTEDFLYKNIAPEYRIVQWLNDPEVDREHQRYLKSLAHKAPYIDSEIEDELYHRHLSTDFKLDGEIVNGLGVAYLLDGLAVSFNTNERWNSTRIGLIMEFIDEHEDISSEQIDVNHASQPSHLLAHTEWFNLQIQKNIQDGKELWKNRETIFPYLIFSDNIENQIMDLHNGQPIFRQIIKRLFEINAYFSGWSNGPFNPELFSCKVTPESGETLRHFKSEHTFKCPDGTYRLFSWHARMTPGAWRIFFDPDEPLKKGIIGYIGLKLPNVTYPT